MPARTKHLCVANCSRGGKEKFGDDVKGRPNVLSEKFSSSCSAYLEVLFHKPLFVPIVNLTSYLNLARPPAHEFKNSLNIEPFFRNGNAVHNSVTFHANGGFSVPPKVASRSLVMPLEFLINLAYCSVSEERPDCGKEDY